MSQPNYIIKYFLLCYSIGVGCCRVFLKHELLRLLPAELVTAKVTIGARLAVDWLLQIQLLDDLARTQVKVLLDDLEKLGLGLGGRAV